jgi:DNA-binding transcriptional MerR regulator
MGREVMIPMQIQEVEAQVGISKKNIRFYESEGLIHPGRNRENGYRDYRPAEVEMLKKIRLLRQLGLPLEEIRRLQSGALNLEDAMARQRIALGREIQNLEHCRDLCSSLDSPPWKIWTRTNSCKKCRSWSRKERILWTQNSRIFAKKWSAPSRRRWSWGC